MDLPATSWLNLALQIPLALVIVFLVVKFLQHLEKLTTAMFAFLENQQVKQSESLGRLAEEIKSNRTDTVRELANLTQRVDGVIDKAIMLERLLPEKKRAIGDD